MFGEQYDVTVITDPPSGPFLIGNRITFTCHVYPMPPEPVTYSWHAMRDAYGPTYHSLRAEYHSLMGVGTGVATGARAPPVFELTFHICSSE